MAEKAKKTIPSKKAVKPEAKTAEKKVAKVTSTAKRAEAETETVASSVPATVAKKSRNAGDVTVDVVSPQGKTVDTMNLPESIFAAKVNKQLMAQAVRVYLANQRESSASSKTRGEVEGSTRKIYKQKGTGNARHGSIRAPIFVKGGVALGPKPHSFHLDFPKKMRKAALASAMTTQFLSNAIHVLSDYSSLELKTKVYAQMFTDLSCVGRTLVLLAPDELTTVKAMRNLKKVDVLNVTNAHTYTVLHHKHIVMTKKAVTEMEVKFSGKETV